MGILRSKTLQLHDATMVPTTYEDCVDDKTMTNSLGHAFRDVRGIPEEQSIRSV